MKRPPPCSGCLCLWPGPHPHLKNGLRSRDDPRSQTALLHTPPHLTPLFHPPLSPPPSRPTLLAEGCLLFHALLPTLIQHRFGHSWKAGHEAGRRAGRGRAGPVQTLGLGGVGRGGVGRSVKHLRSSGSEDPSRPKGLPILGIFQPICF